MVIENRYFAYMCVKVTLTVVVSKPFYESFSSLD